MPRLQSASFTIAFLLATFASAQPPKGGPKPLAQMESGMASGVTLAITPDGKTLFAAGLGKEKNVQIWDVKGPKQLFTLDSATYNGQAVAISPDGKVAACVGDDRRTVAIIDLATGKEQRQLLKKGGPVVGALRVDFSPKGDVLVQAARTHILGWDPTSSEQRFAWPLDKKDREVTAFSVLFDDGTKIAAGTESGVIRVWDLTTGKPSQTMTGGHDRKQVMALAVSPDGKTLVSAALIGKFKVWDVGSGKVTKEIDQDLGLWANMRFLPDGKTLVYIDTQNRIALLDVTSGTKKLLPTDHAKHIFGMALTADGKTAASADTEGKIRVWDLGGAK